MTSFDSRLRSALGEVAGVHPATGAQWVAVQDKIEAFGAASSELDPVRDGDASVSWMRRWRTPLLAAAAVAVIAVIAVTALGPGGDRGASPTGTAALGGTASPGDTGSPAGTESPGDTESPAGTESPGDTESLGDTTAPPSPSTSPTSEAAPDGGTPVEVPVASQWDTPQQFTMELMGGMLRVSSENNADYLGDDLMPDASPLGYVRAAPARPPGWSALDSGSYSFGVIPPPGNEGGSYAYGIVGPAVDRVAIVATDAGLADPIESGAGPVWIVGGEPSEGTGDSAGGISRATWTDLGDDWHAFAVQAPAPSASITALAYGSDGAVLQARRWTNDGHVADLPTDGAPSLDQLVS